MYCFGLSRTFWGLVLRYFFLSFCIRTEVCFLRHYIQSGLERRAEYVTFHSGPRELTSLPMFLLDGNIGVIKRYLHQM